MNIFKYLAPLLVAPSLTFAQSSLAQDSKPDLNQKLTMYAKPAVVRVVSLCEGEYKWKGDSKNPQGDTFQYNLSFFGTGFLIHPNGYIVTSSKVTESKEDCRKGLFRNIKYELNKIVKDDISDQYIKKNGNLTMYFGGDRNEDGNRKYEGYWEVHLPYSQNNPLINKNSKLFDVKKSGRKEGEFVRINKDVAIIKVSLSNAPVLRLGDSSQVQIQDRIVAVGYPIGADIKTNNKNIKFTQKSIQEASVQGGRISNPNKELEGGYPVLQVDIRVAEGSAGSPLINEKGKVVGMLVFNDSDQDSLDNNGDEVPIAIPTSTIQEFIRQSGATNQQGETDQLYKEGLQDFWKGNYQEAKTKFLKVRALFPFHSEVERKISEIDQIEADWWANPWKNPTYIFLLALLVGGGIVGAVAYFLLRQRQQPATATTGDVEGSSRANSSYNSAYNSSYDSAYNSSYKRNGKGKKCFMEMEYKGQIQRFQLGRSEHRLGRDPAWSDLDIPTSWEVISRRHGILKKEEDDYRIFDGDRQTPSRNGLWVNDDFRVDTKEGRLLHNGDRLKIGQDKNEQVLITYFNPNQKDDGGGSNPKTTMAN